MEENEKVLFDYLYIIWKRKVFIVVSTLVCIVIGVVMSLMSPVTYRAETLVRIGKGVTTNVPALLDEPENLVTTIPVVYARDIYPGYAIRVDVLARTPMIRLAVKGPDGGKASESLEKIVGELVKDHRILSEQLVESYRVLAKGIGEYIEVNAGQMAEFSQTEQERDVERLGYLGKLDIMNDLRERTANIVVLKRESEYKMYVNSLRANMTKMLGVIEVEKVPVRKIKYVVASGVVGLTISIFLAIFVDYFRNAMRVRERQQRT